MPAPLHPRHNRHNAIAQIEAHVAEAEEVRARYARQGEACTAAGKDARRDRVLLRMAEERLDQLRRSREMLLSGEPEERQS